MQNAEMDDYIASDADMMGERRKTKSQFEQSGDSKEYAETHYYGIKYLN